MEEIPKPKKDTVENDLSFNDFKNQFSRYSKELFDLEKGVDKQATIKEIKDKTSMSGPNSWMLMCSIMIASIGLNLNSQAVIIGAMLISPLMSPILGIGLAVGINDLDTLKKSLFHFGIAIVIALVVSTLYFSLTPLVDYTEQIEARTAPTFLDILIAVFGGIAGIISIARKDISTTLPGVAIATALMPPLCVCGYGIAGGHWDIAYRSFYLFFLNSFFVALATYIMVRFMHFPYKTYVSALERRRNRMYMFVFSLIIIIPSVLIFSDVYRELQTKIYVDKFIDEYIGDDREYLDGYVLFDDHDGQNELVLRVYGNVINKNRLEEYHAGLEQIGLKNTTITIIPTSEIHIEDFKKLEGEMGQYESLASRLEEIQKEKIEQRKLIEKLSESSYSNRGDSLLFSQFITEMEVMLPELNSLSISKGMKSNVDSKIDNVLVIIPEWKSKISLANQNKLRGRIRNFAEHKWPQYEVEVL